MAFPNHATGSYNEGPSSLTSQLQDSLGASECLGSKPGRGFWGWNPGLDLHLSGALSTVSPSPSLSGAALPYFTSTHCTMCLAGPSRSTSGLGLLCSCCPPARPREGRTLSFHSPSSTACGKSFLCCWCDAGMGRSASPLPPPPPKQQQHVLLALHVCVFSVASLFPKPASEVGSKSAPPEVGIGLGA